MPSDHPLYIASWSAPRNISTAMMRSWENRGDTFVCDEPFYAHYLLEHGHDHPGREEILQHHESDLERVIEWLTGPIPEGKRIFYQKQMTHHLLPEVPRDWMSRMTHIFLIREPREMLTSLMRILPEPTLFDTGLPQQVEVFERVKDQMGDAPPVVDARDVLENPRRMLGQLCDRLEIDFREQMLRWPAGGRETDGVWAPHWYASVEATTGFAPYRRKSAQVPENLLPILEEAEACYQRLYPYRILST